MKMKMEMEERKKSVRVSIGAVSRFRWGCHVGEMTFGSTSMLSHGSDCHPLHMFMG